MQRVRQDAERVGRAPPPGAQRRCHAPGCTGQAQAQALGRVALAEKKRDVEAALRGLRYSAELARQGASVCDGMREAPLEDCVRAALKALLPAHLRRALPNAGVA